MSKYPVGSETRHVYTSQTTWYSVSQDTSCTSPFPNRFAITAQSSSFEVAPLGSFEAQFRKLGLSPLDDFTQDPSMSLSFIPIQILGTPSRVAMFSIS